MSEQQTPAAASPPTVMPTQPGFPSEGIPVIYADGVANIAPSAQVIKFYLYRTDPNTGATYPPLDQYKNQICAQIIMPTASFVQICMFFERSLKQLVTMGIVAQEQVNALNAAMGTMPVQGQP